MNCELSRTDIFLGRKAKPEGDVEESPSKKVKTEGSDADGEAGETTVESEFN